MEELEVRALGAKRTEDSDEAGGIGREKNENKIILLRKKVETG
jgi:hypothetical protein